MRQQLHSKGSAVGQMEGFDLVTEGTLTLGEVLRLLEEGFAPEEMSPMRFLGYGACFALAGCLWGTGFYWGRLALNEMSVEHMVLYRFLFASLGMLPVAFIHRRRFRLTAAERGLLLLCAFLGVPLQFLLQFHGLARTTVSHASLMVGAMPVLLAAAAALFAPKGLQSGTAGPLRLAGPLRFHGGRGAHRPGRQPGRPRAVNRRSSAT
jgi:hypothetical protein